jgi:hypothetical protein
VLRWPAIVQQIEIDGIPHPEPKENGSLALMRIVEKLALDPTADANKLAVLLDVKLKWEADEARKAFELAFQQFKRNLPVILKGKHVTFPTKSGGETDYWHAELDKAAPIIQEALLSYGIDQSWETGDVGGRTTVTCVLKGFGHTERASTLSGPPDTSGGKNSIQAIGSTTTYLQRYTLFASSGSCRRAQTMTAKPKACPRTQSGITALRSTMKAIWSS